MLIRLRQFLLLACITASLSAQTFNTLFRFDTANGASPGPLTLGLDGNLYGVTYWGEGTVFKITPGGDLTTFYSFCADPFGCSEGSGPTGTLIQAEDGTIYGITEFGGAYGYGTVYKVTRSGELTTLHSFCAQTGCPDGANPATG